MNEAITNATTAFVGGKLLRNFKLRWVAYGAAAYFGLRYMRRNGIFPRQADAALNVIDRGLRSVKSQIGLGGSRSSAGGDTSVLETPTTH